MIARERVEYHLECAIVTATNERTRAHLRAALRALSRVPASKLAACAVCGAVGFPERIRDHECRTAFDDHGSGTNDADR